MNFNKLNVSLIFLVALAGGLAIGYFAGKGSPPEFPEVPPHNTGGPEALAAALTDLKVSTTPQKISQLAGTDTRGTSLLGLKQAVEALGLRADGKKLSLIELEGFISRHQTVIAFINNNRYVWVRKAGPQSIFIKDGKLDFKEVPVDDWCLTWFKSPQNNAQELPPSPSKGKGICLIISPKL